MLEDSNPLSIGLPLKHSRICKLRVRHPWTKGGLIATPVSIAGFSVVARTRGPRPGWIMSTAVRSRAGRPGSPLIDGLRDRVNVERGEAGVGSSSFRIEEFWP
jgi:hypothetical protein